MFPDGQRATGYSPLKDDIDAISPRISINEICPNDTVNDDLQTCFFFGFSDDCGLGVFVILNVSARQDPVVFERFEGTPEEQDVAVYGKNDAGCRFGVVPEDEVAVGADQSVYSIDKLLM